MSSLENQPRAQADMVIFIKSLAERGGTEIMALNLAEALNRHGVSCIIVTQEKCTIQDDMIISLPENIVQNYNHVESQRVNKVFRYKRHWECLKRVLADVIRLYKAKVFVNFTYDLLPSTPKVPECCSCGIFHWSVNGYNASIFNLISHKKPVERMVSKVLFKRESEYIKKWLTNLDKIIVLTEAGRQEAMSLNKNLPGADIKVIPNFIPFDKPARELSSLESKTLLFVGRLSQEKGCRELLDIWEQIRNRGFDCRLRIFGKGPEEQDMMEIIRSRNLPDIEFCGFATDLRKIYRDADLLLCTSKSEGFGLVLIEAMYFGVIPVAFDCPVSPRELIRDGGVTVVNGDKEAFANAVCELLSSTEAMKRIQKNAVIRASEFLETEVISKWKNLIYNT